MLCYNCLGAGHGDPLLWCSNNVGTAFPTSTLKPFCLSCLTFTRTICGIKRGLNVRRNILLLPKIHAWEMLMSNRSNVYPVKKGRSALGRRKSSQEVHRCSLLPLSVDEPKGGRIYLNFNKYVLLCTVIPPLRGDKRYLHDLLRFSPLVPCPTPISARA